MTYNDVLALDRGNKTNYMQDTPVKYNIMDADAVLLITKKDGETVDSIAITENGVIEKRYSDCCKCSAHCVLKDKSVSDSVEFIQTESTLTWLNRQGAGP